MAAVVALLFAGVWWTGIMSLDERMNAKFDLMRAEFRTDFKEVDGKFTEVRAEFKELNSKFDDLRVYLQRSAERFEDDKRFLDRQYITIRDELKYSRSCASNNSSAAAGALRGTG